MNISKYFLNNNAQNQYLSHPKSGLINLGATCYINTTLQCLTNMPYFANFILKGYKNWNDRTKINIDEEIKKHKYKKYYESGFDDYFLILQLRNAIIGICNTNIKEYIPKKFILSLIVHFNENMNIYEQNDMHELLIFIINRINEEIKISPLLVNSLFNK
jgi:ubiquitin carboxyl-terminal hydrolase 4/11/15